MHLRDWIKQAGLTQETFGLRISPPVSAGKVSHWLNGTRRISLIEAIQIYAMSEGRVTHAELAALYRAAPAAVPQASGCVEAAHAE